MDEEKLNELKAAQKIDQGMAMVADRLPAFWRRIYDNTLAAGFDQYQAMDLLKTYILSCGAANK